MKKLLVAFFISFINLSVFGQTHYDRSSISIVYLNFNQAHSSAISAGFSTLQVPEKYYANPIKNNALIAGFERKPVPKGMEMLPLTIPDQDILNCLKENKVAQQILSNWFNRQEDGTFNTSVLKERGLYNAIDNEFILATASKRGTANLMDMGLDLVNQSYVLVLDFFDVMTIEEYYVKKNIPENQRTSNGYKAKIKSYLYKLDFSEAVANDFFQNYWTTAEDIKKSEKSEAFNKATFTFQVLGKQQIEVESTQFNETDPKSKTKPKTKEKLMEELIKSAVDKINKQLEFQNKDLRVKTMVSGVHPIRAKIGKKEGLGFDQRYYVYENRMKKNGTLYPQRISVIKSSKVVDNRKVASGESQASEFYHIASGKVDNVGMYIEQHNDAGVNLFLGYSFKGLLAPTLRLEYYISKLMGELIPSGKSGKKLTSIKVYVEGAYTQKDYMFDFKQAKYTFTDVSFGLSKDYYPLKFIHFSPFVGYGLEFSDLKNLDLKLESDFLEAGARLGLNLKHNVQIVGSLNYYYLMNSKMLDKSDVVLNKKFDYKGTFPDRMGVGESIGLRLMF